MTSMQDALTEALSHPIDPDVSRAKRPLQKRVKTNPAANPAWGWGVAGLAASLLAFGIFRGMKKAQPSSYAA